MKLLRRAGSFLLIIGAAAASPLHESRTEAISLYTARQYTAARAAFQALNTLTPDDPELNFYLGRLALWFDDEPAALLHLQRAAAVAPNDPKIQNALGDACGLAAQNANILAKLGWAKKCHAAYERAIELDPGNPAFRWSLLGYCVVAPRIAGGGLERRTRKRRRLWRSTR